MTLQNDDEVTASGSGASPFAMIGGEFTNKRELFDNPFSTTLIGAFSYNSDPDASRFNTLFGSMSFDMYTGDPETDNWLNVFALGSSVMFLNSDGLGFYNFTQTLGWRPILRSSDSLTVRMFLPIRYQLYTSPSTGDAADERSGFGLRPEVAFDFTTDLGRWIVTGIFEWHQSRGQNYQTLGGRIPVKYLKMLNDIHFYSLDGEVGHTNYPQATEERADTYFSLGGTYGRKFGDHWSGRFTYNFKRNASTATDASYNKHLFQLEAQYAAF